MTLIRDLIEIPVYVQRGDFVLRLSEGVTRPEETLRDYVVTPELRGCFDDALAFIRSALDSHTSKASYLHGSFGSGKSHFMAVLHLILQGNPSARGIPELAPVIARHNAWTTGRKFLLVPYHMIGARDMEQGILGGYVEFMRRTHPDAPIPGVYLAEGLFRDAENLRRQMGDEAFFTALGSSSSGDGWGDLDAGWDADRFEAAVVAPPGSEERSQLIRVLISGFFGSYDVQAGASGEAFLPLDTGLSVISKHAADLGYDALILFLDELILWLASHAADLAFVHREGQKLAKLVEAQTPDRPVPVVSFVARQRDLRELIGDAVPGADRLNFSDSLRHWEGRFHRITLEDRNLPAIAEKRVLKCRSESARRELDAAFEQTVRMREPVLNALLTREGDRAMFRKVYPFSPALVQTLIAVSSVLQRERTALKVMVQLLVDHRDTLSLGDLVPVGDLFDVVAHGDEAFSAEMAIHFDNAKRLYHQKLLPLLERDHGRREELEQLPPDDPRRERFRTDDRLMKTLLLGALVPEVETLRSLNAERLAALNHGSIRTPIAGREGQEVLRRCRTWAASVGEIRIGEEANPTISIQLSGVDTQAIIEQARGEDNQGNRLRRVREMLFERMRVRSDGEPEPEHEFLWRNTRRSCTLLFRCLRELTDTALQNESERWKLVIDYPFDEAGRSRRDALSRIQTFLNAHASARTLCWVPDFLSPDAQKDLGLLVILEHVLSGERFGQYAGHLSAQDRPAAKSILENQRSVLVQRVANHLDAVYGLDALTAGSADPAGELDLGEHFASLDPGFQPRPPSAGMLDKALEDLLSQALAHQFPAAPEFEAEIKATHLQKVWQVAAEAAKSEDGRVLVERTLRPLVRQIANPLKLGEMAVDATHFVLGRQWQEHFLRKAAQDGGGLDVGRLRGWFDEPRPMGLPRDAQNLVILTFALQTNRGFYRHGGPIDATLSSIPDDAELREQMLPGADIWQASLARAAALFGITASPLLNASNVSWLASQLKTRAAGGRGDCDRYRKRLGDRLEEFGIRDGAERLATASGVLELIEAIHESEERRVLEVLAAANLPATEAAMGESLRGASDLAAALDGPAWDIFELVIGLPDETDEAVAIIESVKEALRHDELVMPLISAVKGTHARAMRLLRTVTGGPAPGPRPAPGGSALRGGDRPAPTRTEAGAIGAGAEARATDRDGELPALPRDGAREKLGLAEARILLASLDREAARGRSVRIDLRWTIDEPGAPA